MSLMSYPNVLCSACRRFVQNSFLLRKISKSLETREQHDHHPSLQRLEESARNGCNLCHLLHDASRSYIGDLPAASRLFLLRIMTTD